MGFTGYDLESFVKRPVQPNKAGEDAGGNGLRKAAILVAELGEPAAARLLEKLGARSTQKVTEQIAELGDVSPLEREQVLREFCEVLSSEQHVLDDSRLDPSPVLETAWKGLANNPEGARTSAGEEMPGAAAALRRVEPRRLSEVMKVEHPQTVALVVAHLNPALGSKVMAHLGARMRTDVFSRIAEMRRVPPARTEAVLLALVQKTSSQIAEGERSYAGPGVAAELLKHMDPQAREEVLKEMEAEQPHVAAAICSVMASPDAPLAKSDGPVGRGN